MKKIRIDNGDYMELIDELATQITEMKFKEDTWDHVVIEEIAKVYRFTEEAQDYYNEKYDEYDNLMLYYISKPIESLLQKNQLK